MGIILATVNQKGGVGKTTTAVNLAAYLATYGKKILLIDSDPQGNASSGLGFNRKESEKCLYNVLICGQDPKNVIEKSSIIGLDLIPATPKLSGAEVELVAEMSRETKLKNAIEPLREIYDFIIIDCPPSLNLLTINALTAANEVLIPIQCEYYALEGLSQLNHTLTLIKQNLNPGLKIRAIILTMYNSRTLLSEQVAEEARKHFGSKVLKTIVPRNIRLAEAPSFGQPIIFYDPGSSGALAYEELTKELLEREVTTW